VQLLDDGRTRDAQHLVAALERLTAEVMRAELAKLQVGPRRAVIDHDALADLSLGSFSRCSLWMRTRGVVSGLGEILSG